ncbi:MAG: hypothetical protein JWM57_407 [Phycisphaerales bacterium]|nr:hypothetical protein [Phycisphaerales bacterium]
MGFGSITSCRAFAARTCRRLREAVAGGGLVAAAFHVAPNGSDANPGTIDAPWATLEKVAAAPLRPGESVLFQRGGAWHGQLLAQHDGLIESPITYGDYGDANLAAPTFYGSDDVTPTYTSLGRSVYSFPTSASPNGKVFWVYLNHRPLLAATAGGADMPAQSFFIAGDTLFIHTGGVDPANATISVGDRATGQDAQQGVICSNGRSNLIFRNLIGRETAQVPDGGKLAGGVIDAYVIRVQDGSNVKLDHCEAYYGGKHNVGAINTTGFVAHAVRASGAVDGVEGNRLGYGNATAFVAYASGQARGCTQTWTDCTVTDYPGNQPAFITHNDGADSLKSLTVENLHVVGSPIALMPGPNVAITFRGGLFENVNFIAYTSPGTTQMFDGLHLKGEGSVLAVSGHATVQNCLITGSAQDGGLQADGPANVLRFNTVVMRPNSGPAVHLRKSATGTTLLGNLLAGAQTVLSLDGPLNSLTADYDVFDTTAGAPQCVIDGKTNPIDRLRDGGQEAHSASGAVQFVNAKGDDFTLAPGSPAIDHVPIANGAGLAADGAGHVRPQGRALDAGALETVP